MKKYNKTLQNIILYSILAVYIVILCHFLLFKYCSIWELFNENRSVVRGINIIPFDFITNSLSRSFAIFNVSGNIVLFIPLGVYLPLLKRDKRIYMNILWVFLISLSVEIMQYILSIGISDIDDVIQNCLGGFIGIVAYKSLLSIFKDESKVRFIITTTAPIAGFLITYALILYNS